MKKLILSIVLFVTVPVMAMQDSGSSLQIDRVQNQKSNGIALAATASSSRSAAAQKSNQILSISSPSKAHPRSRSSNGILRNSTHPINLQQNAKQKKIVDFDLEPESYLFHLAKDFYLCDQLGDTWLMWAMYNNKPKTAKMILDNHLYNINDCDADGDSILLIATRQKKFRIASKLIDNGADVNAISKKRARPLHWVTYHNNTTLSIKLIKKGALINAQEPDGNTALHWATYHNNMPITKALLKRGAKPNLKGKLGNRPLMYAVKNGNEEMVRYLIKYNANVNLPNDNLETPLFWAVYEKQNQIAILLLNNNAWVNQRAKDGRTALIAACATANKQLIVELIKRGANLNNKDDAGNTPESWVYESEDDEFKSWFKTRLQSRPNTIQATKSFSKTSRARRGRTPATESEDESTTRIPHMHPKKLLLRRLAQNSYRKKNTQTVSWANPIAQFAQSSPTQWGSSGINLGQSLDGVTSTPSSSSVNQAAQSWAIWGGSENSISNSEEEQITNPAFFADPFAQDLDEEVVETSSSSGPFTRLWNQSTSSEISDFSADPSSQWSSIQWSSSETSFGQDSNDQETAQTSSWQNPFSQWSTSQLTSSETQVPIRAPLNKTTYDYDALVYRFADPVLINILHTRNLDKNQLLVAAAKRNRNELAKALIARNANVNTQDDMGDTPLMCAERNSNIKLISILGQAGANPHTLNRYGVSAPLIALANNRQAFANSPLDNPHLLDAGRRFINGFSAKSAQKPSSERITLSSRSPKAPRRVEQRIQLEQKKTYQSQAMMTIISRNYDRLDSSDDDA